MLNGPLLEKLGGTVKKLLDDKDTAAADGGALQQLAERDAKIAELEAKIEVSEAKVAELQGGGVPQEKEQAAAAEGVEWQHRDAITSQH